MRNTGYAERIICLTEEPTEILYLLGEQDRIVGISGFTVRPPRARREKPRVSAFTSAKLDKILALNPDLVLGFSDLQADIAADLIRAGVQVHIFNQRSVAGILGVIRAVGAMVGAAPAAEALAETFRRRLTQIQDADDAAPRPRVYFEEWDDPMISAIEWVAELIRIAGGDDCFPELAREPMGRNRIIADPAVVVERRPDIIIGSWCGKKFRPERVRSRPGFDRIPAVIEGRLYEVKSSLILQPGPAALTDGVDALHRIIKEWREHVAKT